MLLWNSGAIVQQIFSRIVLILSVIISVALYFKRFLFRTRAPFPPDPVKSISSQRVRIAPYSSALDWDAPAHQRCKIRVQTPFVFVLIIILSFKHEYFTSFKKCCDSIFVAFLWVGTVAEVITKKNEVSSG